MITGKAKIAGVMGWPVAHSRSPLLHNAWLQRYGIDGAYVPLAVNPKGLETALRALPALGFAGCNITVPHKENAAALVDAVDTLARKVGAINTVIVDAEGKLLGSNTDVYGFTKNLEQSQSRLRPDSIGAQSSRDKINWKKPALVVGAGGAARAVIVALYEAGCRDIRLVNRTSDRAIALGKEMNENLDPSGREKTITILGWPDREDAMKDIALLVNTTTQGMEGQPPLELDLRALSDEALVTDLVYTPLMTPLLLEAKRRGHSVVDGLGMLLHQAAPGFEAWFGKKPEVDEDMRNRVLQDLKG